MIRVKLERKVEYDDDIVIVKNSSGEIVYKGIDDYNPYRDEPWKYDSKNDIYILPDGYGGYTLKCENSNTSNYSKIEESGNDTVVIGLYGDDCGKYRSLDEFISILKKSGIEILDSSGDEEYGWEMTVRGTAKDIYKLVDDKIPGYNSSDVNEFVDEYSVEEYDGREEDLTEAPEDHSIVGRRASKKDIIDALKYNDNGDIIVVKDQKGHYFDIEDILPDTDNGYGVIVIDTSLEDDYDKKYGKELDEDTVKKSNGKWTNKGKHGEHGEFRTKKAADAQRKAMFANGYKGESVEESLSGNKMRIVVGSGISSDGFRVYITDNNGEEIFKNRYDYGYNASYSKDFSEDEKPYVSDIIDELCNEYEVDKSDIEVVSGKNVFQDKPVDDKAVIRFRTKYLGESIGSPEHPAWLDDLDDSEYSDFDDGEVHAEDKFVEDGIEYAWVEPVGDVYRLDFDAWQVWKACSENNEEAYFVVDIDTGFIDWGPCETREEAIEFLDSKVNDYDEDL